VIVRVQGPLAGTAATGEPGAVGRASIDEVRDICAALPECEVAGDQHHKLSVRGKTIGWHTVDHHGDGRVALTVKAAKGENAALVASDPDKFFMPPYVAHHGYVGIYLDTGDVDWDEVRELVVDAYRLAAPKRLAAQVD
jgi:hypothetical protein